MNAWIDFFYMKYSKLVDYNIKKLKILILVFNSVTAENFVNF
jgi:hypothetical protein